MISEKEWEPYKVPEMLHNIHNIIMLHNIPEMLNKCLLTVNFSTSTRLRITLLNCNMFYYLFISVDYLETKMQ